MTWGKAEFKLKQQTPIIHFQHDEPGACLRASEVKPKLDRFLFTVCRSTKTKIHYEWCLDSDRERKSDGAKEDISTFDPTIRDGLDSPHFDYKIRFVARGSVTDSTIIKSDEIEAEKRSLKLKDAANHCTNEDERVRLQEQARQCHPNNPIGNSYFGNMLAPEGAPTLEQKQKRVEDQYKESVFYTKDIDMIIICFHEELLDLLRANLQAFFLLHNFGTRQNKGFGSFCLVTVSSEAIDESMPTTCNDDPKAIIAKYHTLPFYFVSYSEHNRKKQLEDIAGIYQLMKTGINQGTHYARATIFKYFHERSIGNEKARIKQLGIAPKVSRRVNIGNGEHTGFPAEESGFRYVRALLGVGNKLRYIRRLEEDEKPDQSNPIIISISQDRIERFASPILFKVVGKYTFIIPLEISRLIYYKKFKFDSKNYTSIEPKNIKTPKEKEFDIVDFLDFFIEDFAANKCLLFKLQKLSDINLNIEKFEH